MKKSKDRHRNITGVPECYQDLNSLKKLWYNAQSEKTDHTVSKLYMEESICHAHMSLRVAENMSNIQMPPMERPGG